jgi:hypothetical protein
LKFFFSYHQDVLLQSNVDHLFPIQPFYIKNKQYI